jgi:(R)-2-hydroxyacyl-CoA dehydratese activating ATPase
MNSELYIGIDVGSLSTDAVIIDSEEKIINSIVLPTGASIATTIEKCKEELTGETGELPEKYRRIVSTGYGRKRVSFATEAITEITAHALGALHCFGNTRSVIDIGGQDTKVIRLTRDGKVNNFLMNDKCAAGTGRFLEVMARILEMDLEEMAASALETSTRVKINSTCTVFIESEVISLIADGYKPSVIAASVFKSIAERILSQVKEIDAKPPFTLTGGVAKNRAMTEALKNTLPGRVIIPEAPQLIGALGAALYACRKSQVTA